MVPELGPDAAAQMKAELDRMRAGLLDLSARNPLLNYTHPRARSLRIVDEVPAIVLERLVDMAVVDPKRPGRYLLAIECDGATYHSAKSARDRDRLRQGVLESLGWKVHRIWSTDWFRDPHEETAKVIRRLSSLIA